MIKFFEIFRIVGVTAVIFFGYYFYSGTPAELLHFLTPWLILLIAGLSGIEGLFFGKVSAAAKGYTGGNEYQLQTALFFIAMTIVAIFLYIMEWGVKADLTMALVFMLSFFLSSLNHAYQAMFKGNRSGINMMRPLLTLAMIAALIYPMIEVWE
ncbi:MAG: hypothetical protein U5Q03_11225 [Bacteroidota bacterium]|nr:hypothetical protein [Bacteroidota bacterium]